MGSAYDYMRRYRNLHVRDLATGHFLGSPVDVHQYRNNGPEYLNAVSELRRVRSEPAPLPGSSADVRREYRQRQTEAVRHADHCSELGLSELASLVSAVQRRSGGRGLDLSGASLGAGPYGGHLINRGTLQTAFTGKSRWEVSGLALELAAWSGRLDALGMSLQAYANAFLGLDCSGFLANCLREMGRSPSNPQTDSKRDALWVPLDRRRASVSEIRQYDVICFTNVGHVGIIDTVPEAVSDQPDQVRATVIECCGTAADVMRNGRMVDGPLSNDGLQSSVYTFTRTPWAALPPERRGANTSNTLRDGEFQFDRGMTRRVERSTGYIGGST